MSEKEAPKELPPGRLVLRGNKPGAWRIDMDNPAAIERALGRDLMIALMRCLVGVDRILSLRRFFILNFTDREAKGHVLNRDRWFLFMLFVGTMHEFGEALTRLEKALAQSNRPRLSSWPRLLEMRKRWFSARSSSDVRNQLAHHLGDDDVYAKGLDLIATRASLSLFLADSPRRSDGSFEGAWYLVAAGLKLEQPDYERLFHEVTRDASEIDDAMSRLFVAVVKSSGVELEDQRSDDGEVEREGSD